MCTPFHRQLFCLIVTAVLCTVIGPTFGSAQGTSAPQQDPPAIATPKPAPGINEGFLDPNLNVEQWVERFELESREIYTSRTEILKALNLQPGQRVADVGAGTGFFSLLFAEQVGESGWVYAVDIAPRFIEYIRNRAEAEQVHHLTPVMCSQRQISLPPDSVDCVFVCDTYHHFEFYPDTLASIFQALKPGGEFVVIDFQRVPGKSRPWILDHVRAGQTQVTQEIEAAGFVLQEEIQISGFAENYCLRFKKPEGSEKTDGIE